MASSDQHCPIQQTINQLHLIQSQPQPNLQLSINYPSYTIRMAPITINVTGTSTFHHAPEQAQLSFYAQSDGPSADEVSRSVTATTNHLQETLRELRADTNTETNTPPLTNFKTSSLHSWSERPRDRDGNYKDRIYHAQLRIEATFVDFKRLASFAGRLAAFPTVSISNIAWQLKPETSRALSSQTRKLAMADAIEKAADLAGVVGRAVEPVEVSDSGSGNGPGSGMLYGGARKMRVAAASSSMDDDRQELDLTPEDVELSSSLYVVFKGE